jgi:hypothetical protein
MVKSEDFHPDPPQAHNIPPFNNMNIKMTTPAMATSIQI